MQQFSLLIRAHHLAQWDAAPGTNPLMTENVQHFETLKEAHDALHKLDPVEFNLMAAFIQKVPRYIEHAGIAKNDTNVIAIQHWVDGTKTIPDGLYLQINKNNISTEAYNEQTAGGLNNLPVFGANQRDFQVMSMEKLQQTLGVEAKQKRSPLKVVKSNRSGRKR